MKKEEDYIRDIAEIRSMMERSSKFLSLSGWAGIMAGIYALTGAFIAFKMLHFTPGEPANSSYNQEKIMYLALAILIVSFITAIYFSRRNAHKQGVQLWNHTTRQLLSNMAVPLVSGGLLVLVLISRGMIEFAPSLTLLFYGLALFNAGRFTIEAVKVLGLVEIILGLISLCFVEYGLLFWAAGFGVAHIIYGFYMHSSYDK